MKSVNLKVRMYPQEKEMLASMALRARISLSELVRRTLVGLKLPTPGRYEAVKELLKVNADLARLGNLLKTALNDERADSDNVNNLIDDLRRDRLRLKEILDTLKDHRKA